MDLKELTAFKTILQEGTFSRAAEKLNYAQSTITSQIQRLEKELGIQLFHRGWDAQLTTAGQVFAEEIDKLIQHWNYVTELTKALGHDEVGTLHIGGIESMMGTVFPNALRKFHEHKPKIECHFVMGNTDSLSQSVLRKELDFAICGEPTNLSSFHFEPLYQEKIAFIVDRNHPLSGLSPIPFQEILEYPIIAGGSTCLYYLRLAKQFSRFESSPTLSTVSQISAIPHFVRQTSSVGAVLDSTHLNKDVVQIEVEMSEPFIQIGLLQPRSREYLEASSRRLFMQFVREDIDGKSKPAKDK
ncbi:LysR family transcriptional regulator [Cohnella mopanensis]|uniref:LysR family transcriptional regulator n=1 Tax=Cohnella mopanensis TaxID=2911966 RepID=UPI001EF9104A|nr:LysR family transcriptional regulator [Cohnella mopanensis]